MFWEKYYERKKEPGKKDYFLNYVDLTKKKQLQQMFASRTRSVITQFFQDHNKDLRVSLTNQ